MFNHFPRKTSVQLKPFLVTEKVDTSGWMGKDFEFLITGDVQIEASEYDTIMTPKSWTFKRATVGKWNMYTLDGELYCVSQEADGIHLSFTPAFTYAVARQIADEIMEKLQAARKPAALVVLGYPVTFLKESNGRKGQ